MSLAPPRTSSGPRVPLRITLVALLVVLVTVGLLATGFAATDLLRRYLLDQRDADLRAQVNAVAHNPRLDELCAAGQYYPDPAGAGSTYLGCVQPGGDTVVDLQGPDDQGDLPAFGKGAVSSGPRSVSSTR